MQRLNWIKTKEAFWGGRGERRSKSQAHDWFVSTEVVDIDGKPRIWRHSTYQYQCIHTLISVLYVIKLAKHLYRYLTSFKTVIVYYLFYLNHKIKTLTIQTHYSIVYDVSVHQSNRNVKIFLGYEPRRHFILTLLHWRYYIHDNPDLTKSINRFTTKLNLN